jgi:hypothetical protein
MNIRRVSIIIFALALMALIAPASTRASVSAAQVSKYTVKGKIAEVGFTDVSDPCVYNSATISMIENQQGNPGPVVFASIYRYNGCDASDPFIYLYGLGTVVNGTFTADNQLTSAAFKGTVEIPDQYGAPVLVDLDLTWAGSGDVFRERTSNNFSGPGYSYRSTYIGTSRDATGSGSIIAYGRNLAQGESYGRLYSVLNGSMYITRRP